MATSPPMTHRRILLAVAVAALYPLVSTLTDTAFLPILTPMQRDLDTSLDAVALTISLFLVTSGVSPLVWGVVTDLFGPKRTTLLSAVCFSLTTLACGFVPSIEGLIAFRALSGLFAGSAMPAAASTVFSVVPIEHRSYAMGILMLGMLIGPTLGPIVGGSVTEGFGTWRASFFPLAGLCLAVVVLVLLFLPDTRQERDMSRTPLHSALVPFKLLARPVHSVLGIIFFLVFFVLCVTYIETSIALGGTHGLSPAGVGAVFVGVGVLAGVYNLTSGRLADVAFKRLGSRGRLVPGMPFQVIGAGFAVGYGVWARDASPVACTLFLCMVQSSVGMSCPGLYAFTSDVAPHGEAAAATSLLVVCQNLGAALGIQVAPPAVRYWGKAPFYSMLGGFYVGVGLLLVWLYRWGGGGGDKGQTKEEELEGV